MYFIFPDTNIFIHGKHFEEIDWPKLFGSDKVTLVIAPSVIAELDKHKYNSNSKVSKRVKNLLPRLEEIIEAPQTCKYNFHVILKKPVERTFETENLDKKEQDDILLATVIEFKSTIKPGDSVVLITNDTGPRLKAKALAITTSKLSQEYMQITEPDKMEKQVIELQNELQQLKNKIPNISLCFNDGDTFLAIKRPEEIKSARGYLEQELKKIKEEFRPLIYKERDTKTISSLQIARLAMTDLTEPQVSDYNQELENFYREYKEYLESQYDHFAYRYNCVEILVKVKNTGFVPATDLDVYLHFPNGFEIVEESNFPKIKKKPSPPYKPKHSLDLRAFAIGQDLLGPFRDIAHINPNLSKINSNVSSADIKRTNSYEVSFHVNIAKHNQLVELDTLFLKFQDLRRAKGFNIDYKVLAANIPQMVKSQLQVKFADG